MIPGLILFFLVQIASVIYAAKLAQSKKLSVPAWVACTIVAGPFGILALLQLPLDRVEPTFGSSQDAPGSDVVAWSDRRLRPR